MPGLIFYFIFLVANLSLVTFLLISIRFVWRIG